MNIKDYLHLYLGCETAVRGSRLTYTNNYAFIERLDSENYSFRWEDIKPILRPLSDMTKEEAIWMTELRHGKGCVGVKGDWAFDAPTRTVIWSNEFGGELQVAMKGIGTRYAPNRKGILYMPNQFLYLLSKNFDLFGLIEAGLAIDKTKLTNEQEFKQERRNEDAQSDTAD